MPTIAVFGATGRTGLLLVQKALDRGYRVNVLVRDPQKIDIEHNRLEVHPGNVLDPVRVSQTMEGADGVISLIGHDRNSPPDLQTRATMHIINAMRQFGVRRLVSITAGAVRDQIHDRPGLTDHAIVFIMKYLAGAVVRNALQDGINHAELIKRTSLDWTIVRAPVLTDDAPKGTYRVGYVGTIKGVRLTRADLVEFIMTEYEQGQFIGKLPFVTNG